MNITFILNCDEYTSCKMSRVYVKNLPKDASEKLVREHFKSIGTISDV